MIDLELFGGFDFTQTDGRTDEKTFGVVESLSRLKNWGSGCLFYILKSNLVFICI